VSRDHGVKRDLVEVLGQVALHSAQEFFGLCGEGGFVRGKSGVPFGFAGSASGFGGPRPLSSSADPAIPGGAICQQTYESVFGSTWRIVVASITAFWAGEFVNSFVMAKMKVLTKGRALWSRTIGSTFVGQGVDSLIFYPVAFLGIWTTEAVITVMITNWALKVAWEAALTPVTYSVVNRLKKAEGIDLYDLETDFSPFATSAKA
jgi:hypothetical protein